MALAPGPDGGRGALTLWPSFLPDGRTFLYYSLNVGAPSEIRIGSLESSETHSVLQAASRAVYAEPGYLLFAREGTLMAQSFDLRTKRATGDPTAIAEDLLYFRDLGQSDFSVAKSGVLSYQAGDTSSRLVWYRRDGTELDQVGDAAHFAFPRLSPDGEKVAVDILDRRSGTTDIALFDLLRGAKSSFVTKDPMADWTPVFSPDGKQVAFASARAGAPHVHVKDLISSNEAKAILPPSGAVQFISDWSNGPEGTFIIYQDSTPGTGSDLMRVAVSGDGTPRRLVDTPFDDTDGVVSADGKWLAYVSTESGRNEVYLRAIGVGSERLPSVNGRRPEPEVEARRPRALLPGDRVDHGVRRHGARRPADGSEPSRQTDVQVFRHRCSASVARGSQFDTKDGQRFLVNVENRGASLPITVDLNWTTRLRR